MHEHYYDSTVEGMYIKAVQIRCFIYGSYNFAPLLQSYRIASWKISRDPIFEDVEVFAYARELYPRIFSQL